MADFPYTLILSTALLANARGTLSYQVPPNERLYLSQIRYVSTGIWSLENVRTSDDRFYSNASQSNPITSTLLQNAASPNLGLQGLGGELIVEPNTVLYLDVFDTSGAGNTIRVLLQGRKVTQPNA